MEREKATAAAATVKQIRDDDDQRVVMIFYAMDKRPFILASGILPSISCTFEQYLRSALIDAANYCDLMKNL